MSDPESNDKATDDEQDTQSPDDSAETPPADEATPGPLQVIRETPRYHWASLITAGLVGLIAASSHWLGLILGGALVGLFSTTTKRALLSGLGFGVFVIAVWVGLLALSGTAGRALSMGQFSFIPVAIGLLAPVVGSLLRGVV